MEIAVEHGVGRNPVAATPQIHQQESKIVKHVDGGDLLAELDGIEEFRLAPLHDDVAAMHVAMAMAHQAALAAFGQQPALQAQGGFVERVELQRIIRPEDVGRVDEGLGELCAETAHDVEALHIASRGKSMGPGGHCREPGGEFGADVAMRHDPSEKRTGGKAAHHQDGLAQHLLEAEVEVRREHTVDLKLCGKRCAALLHSGKVKIGQRYVLLDLEGPAARQEHMRRVRLNMLHRLAGEAPGFALEERGGEHDATLPRHASAVFDGGQFPRRRSRRAAPAAATSWPLASSETGPSLVSMRSSVGREPLL